MRRVVDLNSDVGEDAGAIERDEALAEHVSSLNIACGGHAGDESTMARLVRTAVRLGRGIGAHPGYPDRENFGRVAMELTPGQVLESVAKQVSSLAEIARSEGGRVSHVKPHGALYHKAMRRPEVAEAIAAGVLDAGLSVETVLVGLAGASAIAAWRGMGHPVWSEGFADRRYEADGSLRARGIPGAVLDSPVEAASQAVKLARGEIVVDRGVREEALRVDTLCIHSDTPGAVATARAVRGALMAAGFVVGALRPG